MAKMGRESRMAARLVGATILLTHRRRRSCLLYSAGCVLVICGVLSVLNLIAPSPETLPAFKSRSLEAGLLRVMRYIEREGEVDQVLRDEFVDRIWRSVKIDLFRELVTNSKLGSTGFRINDSVHDFFQENWDVFQYIFKDNRNELNTFNSLIKAPDINDVDNNALSKKLKYHSDTNSRTDRADVNEKSGKHGGTTALISSKTQDKSRILLKSSRLDQTYKQQHHLHSDRHSGSFEIPSSSSSSLFSSNLKSSESTNSKTNNNNNNNNYNNNNKTSVANVDIDTFLSLPVINPFEFSYRYDQPATCSTTRTINVIIAVPSAPGNFGRRKKVRRSSSAMFAKNLKNRARLLFFIGVPDNSNVESSRKIQERIDKEQIQFGDIVQASFVDRYKNISKKSALLLHWSSTYCSTAKFLIRTDDDVIVNIPKMVKAMENQHTKYGHFILGHKRVNWKPERDINSKYSKYFLSYEDYPYRHLPPFLLGGAMGCPIKTSGLLLEAMRRVSLTWLDDVFVMGICARKVGIPVFDSPAFRFDHQD